MNIDHIYEVLDRWFEADRTKSDHIKQYHSHLEADMLDRWNNTYERMMSEQGVLANQVCFLLWLEMRKSA